MMKKQKSCYNKQALIIYPHGYVSKSRRIIKNKKMTVTGFVLLLITWIIVAVFTRDKTNRANNKWQREEKRKRLEEEYAKNLKAWKECKRDFKRRMRKLLGR